MLRKLIYGNNSPPSEPVKVPKMRPAEQTQEFALLVTRLEEYQGIAPKMKFAFYWYDNYTNFVF